MGLRTTGESRGVSGRSITATVTGVSLLLSVMFMLYHGGRRMYYDYYFYAQVKEHYIKPDTRQRVLDVMVITSLIVAMYVAYRLLKYSFTGRAASGSNR